MNEQKAYNVFYATRRDKLPVEYNWKPYWGFNEDARVVHFHGPKAVQVRELLNGRTDVRPLMLRLFRQDPDAYRKYLAVFEEYASD